MPNFDEMNETDVREEIVRPLLKRLGYAHGSENAIRTEQTFRYEKAFLGRKNAAKDPPLVGRADYLLDVVSVGRWVVEVKAPGQPIDQDTIDQAHTYAAHPEVAAMFFLCTNGRTFRLYRTSSLDAPLLAWEHEDTDEVFLALENLVGPEAIRRKVELLRPDEGKPLGRGLASDVQIIGGHVTYEDHHSDVPMLGVEMDQINGLTLPITEGRVYRDDDGNLVAKLEMAKAMPMAGELSELLSPTDGYIFTSRDEYVSTDRQNPTIFQNLLQSDAPPGTRMKIPGLGEMPMPFGFRFAATTDAVGYIDGDTFRGTMKLDYQIAYYGMQPMVRAALEQQFGRLPERPEIKGGGHFEVKLLVT